MSNKFQELTHWHTALPVRRGEMVHQICPGNYSAFAFMTINNSTVLNVIKFSCIHHVRKVSIKYIKNMFL